MEDAARGSLSLELETWSRAHAAVTLVALATAAITGVPWPLVAGATVSFSALLYRSRGAFLQIGRGFGAANAITLTRLFIVLGALEVLHGRAFEFGAVALAVFALDGVDGWIARRSGTVSRFGAHFDMETDAFFILAMALELWQSGVLGAWILMSGVLRYSYVLAIALIPPVSGQVPRSRSGRHGFVILVVGLLSALLLPPRPGAILAALGTIVVTLSFCRSFYFSYGPAPARGLPR